MNKERILLVHNYYQVPGGEDTVVVNEKKMLEDNGHQVILYSRNNSELKEFSKFQKLCLPYTMVFSMRTYREVKKIIREKKIDIVHVHNTLSIISPSIYYAAFACKVPVVQTIHNFRLLCPGATFYREDESGNGHICEDCVRNGLKCAIKHKCYRGSTLLTLGCVAILTIHRLLGTYKKLNYICLTEFNKEKLLQLNNGKKQIIDPEKVFVKPNFVSSKLKCIPYGQRKNQFAFVGRLDKLKGIRLLLEAWKEIKDSELIICGTGPEEGFCRTYIAQNKLHNVKMLGFIPNEEVKIIIGESKAIVLPTQWYEGFPMTIIESLSVGTPVIGSDIGNVGNLIDDYVTGLKFQFNSVESMIRSIENINDMVKTTSHVFKTNYLVLQNYQVIRQIYGIVTKEGAYM